ncbi:hypothetical protein ABVF61_19080 [Roseibium sp. HPY-6]|uniref:hypothetical protein n=1 Tax=Roseibium sp. HPY-6 TaxID=3229852 RepID=UPI00338EE085
MDGVVRLKMPTRKTRRMVCTVERYFDQFNEISNAAAAKKALEDAADLNHKIANVDIGRAHRFLSLENSARGGSKEKKEARRRFQTLLDELLLDPEYAAAYQSASKALGDAETDAETQIEFAKEALAASTAELEELQSKAKELPDGRRVYFDPQTRQVFTEDGEVLDEAAASQIEFTGNEPIFADYVAARQKMDAAISRLEEWYNYQVTLGDFRNELEDQDNPPSKKRLGEIEREIEERKPQDITPEPASSDVKAIDATNTASVSVPKIGSSN